MYLNYLFSTGLEVWEEGSVVPVAAGRLQVDRPQLLGQQQTHLLHHLHHHHTTFNSRKDRPSSPAKFYRAIFKTFKG